MAKILQLDRSGWSEEALARAARFDACKKTRAQVDAEREAAKALDAARAAHPLARALEGVSDASMARTLEGEWRFKAVDFGNGHREACVWRHKPDPERTLERAIDRDIGAKAARGEGDREASSESSVRRARQKVRHLCKAMAVNALWTLTYRENVQDRELVLRHLDAFRRRVVAVLGEWRYIAVLEKQERGAWHVHLATHALPERLVSGGVRLKSWDVMRAIWRRVVGDLGGNFDEAKRRKRFGRGRKVVKGAGAIASYIAGYVAKDMLASELNRKRYSVSKGVDIPPTYRALFPPDTPLRELLELAYAAVGDRITRAWFEPETGVFFVESDDTEPLG